MAENLQICKWKFLPSQVLPYQMKQLQHSLLSSRACSDLQTIENNGIFILPFPAVGFSFLRKLVHITEAPFCIGKQNQKSFKYSSTERQRAHFKVIYASYTSSRVYIMSQISSPAGLSQLFDLRPQFLMRLYLASLGAFFKIILLYLN